MKHSFNRMFPDCFRPHERLENNGCIWQVAMHFSVVQRPSFPGKGRTLSFHGWTFCTAIADHQEPRGLVRTYQHQSLSNPRPRPTGQIHQQSSLWLQLSIAPTPFIPTSRFSRFFFTEFHYGMTEEWKMTHAFERNSRSWRREFMLEALEFFNNLSSSACI